MSKNTAAIQSWVQFAEEQWIEEVLFDVQQPLTAMDNLGFADFMTMLLVMDDDLNEWIAQGPTGTECRQFFRAWQAIQGLGTVSVGSYTASALVRDYGDASRVVG